MRSAASYDTKLSDSIVTISELIYAKNGIAATALHALECYLSVTFAANLRTLSRASIS